MSEIPFPFFHIARSPAPAFPQYPRDDPPPTLLPGRGGGLAGGGGGGASGGGRGGGPGGGLGVQVQRGQLLHQLVQAALLLVDDEEVVGQGGEEGLPPGDHHVPEGDDGVGSVIHLRSCETQDE